ncbi:EAL domain-containing protein [Coralliovum pocilloporae]|uniref:EAL domain-containing protein n=1 Tax=Coralliovum pocilloporae TaxID=3066369 RepID=UPI003306E44B
MDDVTFLSRIIQESPEGVVHAVWHDNRLDSDALPIVHLDDDGGLSIYGVDGVNRKTADGNPASSPVPPASRHKFDDGTLLARCWRAVHILNFAKQANDTDRIFVDVHPNICADTDVIPASISRLVDGILGCGLRLEQVILQIRSEGYPNYENVLKLVSLSRSCGFRIAFSGFGVGGVNLDRMIELEPEFVRIHEHMLHMARETPNGLVLLKGMVRILRDLDIHTILCGVHTEYDLAYARQANVCMVTGRLFGEPAPMQPMCRGEGLVRDDVAVTLPKWRSVA